MSDITAGISLEKKFNKPNLMKLWENFSMMNKIAELLDEDNQRSRKFLENVGGLEIRLQENPKQWVLVDILPDGTEQIMGQDELFDFLVQWQMPSHTKDQFIQTLKEQFKVAKNVALDAGPVSLGIGAAAVLAFMACPPAAMATLSAGSMARVANNCVRFAEMKAKFDKLEPEQKRKLIATMTSKEMLIEIATKWTFLELVKTVSLGIVGDACDEISVLQQVNLNIDDALRSSETGVIADLDLDGAERKSASPRRIASAYALEA